MSVERVYARKCDVVDISHDKGLLKEFLAEHHVQGFIRGIRVAYGLFYNSTLVQIMAFSKPRFNKKYEWEIIREATKQNTQVVGGSSRLFSRFIEEHNPLSVVVYTSIKDKHLYANTDHYRKHMRFLRVRGSYETSVGRWESIQWPRDDTYGKSYSASTITHLGPDRLLGTRLGKSSGTNSDIMRSLDYELKFHHEPSPTTDVWLAVGYLYRVDCSCGKFYIGISTDVTKRKVETYLGSGIKWLNHIKKHKDHQQKKTVLSAYNDLAKLLKDEVSEIEQNIDDELCMNIKSWEQGERCSYCGSFSAHRKHCKLRNENRKACQHCGSFSSIHKKSCPGYVDRARCAICLGGSGNHKKGCLHYTPAQNYCMECGGYVFRHKKSCSLFKELEECSECKMKRKHKMTCSHYEGELPKGFCHECGEVESHSGSCSQWVFCTECESRGSGHKKVCSLYVAKATCALCGGKQRMHKKHCPEYLTKECEECGSDRAHKSTCSQYTERKKCEECNSPLSSHKITCSQYTFKSCAECHGRRNRHRQGCSQYKPLPECDECGGRSNNHKKGCSQYKTKAAIAKNAG